MRVTQRDKLIQNPPAALSAATWTAGVRGPGTQVLEQLTDNPSPAASAGGGHLGAHGVAVRSGPHKRRFSPNGRCACDVQGTEAHDPIALRIKGCAKQPCLIEKGSVAVMEVDFEVGWDVTQLDVAVTAYALGTVVNFPLKQKNACMSLTNAECPLDQYEEITYKLELDIDSNYPNISPAVEIALQDESKKTMMCFRLPQGRYLSNPLENENVLVGAALRDTPLLSQHVVSLVGDALGDHIDTAPRQTVPPVRALLREEHGDR
ncbi:hypothetical protein FOCC_FOCC016210 [Frankliniella occidentalis]|nr:hypothetical protein FOCC_FOCC016210 [Frankliniella occidentalis]